MEEKLIDIEIKKIKETIALFLDEISSFFRTNGFDFSGELYKKIDDLTKEPKKKITENIAISRPNLKHNVFDFDFLYNNKCFLEKHQKYLSKIDDIKKNQLSIINSYESESKDDVTTKNRVLLEFKSIIEKVIDILCDYVLIEKRNQECRDIFLSINKRKKQSFDHINIFIWSKNGEGISAGQYIKFNKAWTLDVKALESSKRSDKTAFYELFIELRYRGFFNDIKLEKVKKKYLDLLDINKARNKTGGHSGYEETYKKIIRKDNFYEFLDSNLVWFLKDIFIYHLEK